MVNHHCILWHPMVIFNVLMKSNGVVIYWRCIVGNEASAEILIKGGADVNLADKNGDTPIHRAAENGEII